MSLWSRDRVRVLIAPDAVRSVRIGGGERTGPVETVPVVQAAQAAEGYTHLIEALRQAVQVAGYRKADAEVLLASQFVRYLLLPWNRDLATDDERSAYARLEFEAIHGERARNWVVALDDQPAGASTLACAIDGALLEQIRTVLTGAQMRVVSIAPQFVRAFNRCRGKLSSKQSAFVFVESGRVSIAWLNRGLWTSIASTRLAGTIAETIATELQQARALGHVNEENGRVYVAFADARESLPAAVSGWEIISLQNGKSSTSRDVVPQPIAASRS